MIGGSSNAVYPRSARPLHPKSATLQQRAADPQSWEAIAAIIDILKTHRTWEDSVGLLLGVMPAIGDIPLGVPKADAVCGSVVSSCGVTIGRHLAPHDRCGLAGARLLGERLVRVTFLDEAGVSNPREEPFLVVAGIMLDPDRHYGTLDARLRTLAEECFPPERSEVLAQVRALGRPFIFHAKDVWHGSGFFPS